METEQSVEETVGELPLSWPLKVQEDEIADEEEMRLLKLRVKSATDDARAAAF